MTQLVTTTWSALKRDFKRLIGKEKYEVAWVKTGPKSRVGRFARTSGPVACEQCGGEGEYFHLVNSSIPYPWIWSYDRLVCHDCHIHNRGETIVSHYDPEVVFTEGKPE